MEAIIQGLNDQQKDAVTSSSSTLQVLAPPGSGKTKTLTARVAYLIAQYGLKPWNIIVCTFTIKAAREMKERIRSFVGEELESKLILGTFHSVARRYLVRYGHHIGIPKDFGIADSSDTLAIIKRIIKRHDFNIEPLAARSRISRRKSRVNNPKSAGSKRDVESQEFEQLFAMYGEALATSNLLDYDDILLRCVELLKGTPKCVSNVEAVLIDEFQDTNTVQYDLMSLFAQHKHRNSSDIATPCITIVGDPDQSIYSFRSAEIKNLGRMTDQYPDTHLVVLEDNYRSSGSILATSLEIIEQDKSRPVKRMLSTHCVGERPVFRTLPSSSAEAFWIVSELKRCTTLTAGLLAYSDFAVLLRSASLSRRIESALGKAGIPYRMVGGHKFFDRVEVKTILDYLRVISHPNHNDAVARVVNVPPRNIGEKTLSSLLEEAETKKWTLWTLIANIVRGNYRPMVKLSSPAERGLENFANVIFTAQKKLSSLDMSENTLADLIEHVLKRLGYREYLKKSHSEDFENRWENVEELMIQASGCSMLPGIDDDDENSLIVLDDIDQRDEFGPEEILTRFLANVALSTDVETMNDQEQPDQVTISTIHAAKGLEWPVVFIPGVFQGSIPHSRAEDSDEERRLLYVGMTRAQSLLYLSWPKKGTSGDQTTISPFLSSCDIPVFFDNRGPSVKFTNVQDLARILRRECPTEDELARSCTTCDRVEDDLFTEADEDDVGHDQFDKHTATHTFKAFRNWANNSYDTHPKRQKICHFTSAPALTENISTLNPHSYSISNTTLSTGFVTATAHKMKLEKQSLSKKDVPPHDFEPEMRISAGAKKRKDPMARKGSILSFFGATAEKEGRESSQFLASSTNVPLRSLPPHPTKREPRPFREIVNVKPSRNEMASITPQLLNHQLRNRPPPGRPQRIHHEDPTPRKSIIFQSSSPPNPDDEEFERGVTSIVTEKEDLDYQVLNPEPKGMKTFQDNASLGTTRPASTFHTTTMAQVMNRQQNSQRRSYGVRMSNNGGWANRIKREQSSAEKPS